MTMTDVELNAAAALRGFKESLRGFNLLISFSGNSFPAGHF